MQNPSLVYYCPSMSSILRTRQLGDLNSSPTKQPHVGEAADPDFIQIVYLLCVLMAMLVFIVIVTASCNFFRRSPALKGLRKKVLNALPKKTFTLEDSLKFSDCAICLTEFSHGDEIRVLPECGHCYHMACIDKWLQKRSSCPSCRQMLSGASRFCCHGGLPLVGSDAAPLETTYNLPGSFIP